MDINTKDIEYIKIFEDEVDGIAWRDYLAMQNGKYDEEERCIVFLTFPNTQDKSNVTLPEEEREKMTERMVQRDIDSIRDSMEKEDMSFLDSVLKGEGWVPYDQLSDEEIIKEYKSRLFKEG